MRTAFLLLVMANLLFFSWTLGYFGERTSGREPQRLAEQLSPESIRLVSTPVPTPVTLLCRRLSGFATAAAALALKTELDTALGASGNWAVSLTNDPPATEYWVGITSVATTALLEKKRKELTTAKFTGLKIIEESNGGPYTILISRFPDEAASKRFLEAQNKALRSASVITRESEAKLTLDITGPGKDFEQRLKELLGARVLAMAACDAGGGAQ